MSILPVRIGEALGIGVQTSMSVSLSFILESLISWNSWDKKIAPVLRLCTAVICIYRYLWLVVT